MLLASLSQAQSGCGVLEGSDSDILPVFSGTLPDVVTTAGGSRFLTVLTNWGFVRASLANPASPSALAIGNVGLRTSIGSPPDYNGGKIPIYCDCAQGGSTMAVAEAPNGSARMFSDWRAAVQGGGLAGQVGRADGLGAPAFAQQISVPQTALGTVLAALYLPASSKFIGYFPDSGGIKLVDATSTTGNPATGAALTPFSTFASWPDVRLLEAATILVGGLPTPMLLGVTGSDGRIRLAQINPITGSPTQVASVAPLSFTRSVAFANVNNRVFVFSAEVAGGLQIYEYIGAALVPVAQQIPGSFERVLVRGGQFPAVFALRSAGANTFLDIYDTIWLTQGGIPRLGRSLPHRGAPVAEPYRSRAFDALVVENGPSSTAYVYRLKTTTVFNGEHILATDTVDITCITFDPSAPPVANAIATNLSAQSRSGSEATTNYYGDRWRIRDASSTGAPLDRIEWDWNYGSPFATDPGWSAALPDSSFQDINPAYFPCDPSGGGDPRTGSSCRTSLGLSNPPAGASFRFALRTRNGNGWSASPFVSSPIPFVAPQARVASFSGGVLTVLSGGNADATPSQGNIADATFAWTFSGGAGGAASGSIAPVPAGATGFGLTVTYRGGYVSSVAGSVTQLDLVPDFSLAPNPALPGSTLTLTNQMQIGNATLDSVQYAINAGASPSPFAGPFLGSSFHPIGGQASVTAPAASGSHNVHVKFNYTASGQSRSAVVSKPLTVLNALGAGLSGPAFASPGVPVSFTATASGGAGGYLYSWKPGEAPSFESYQPGGPTFTHTFAATGTYTVRVRVMDSSQAQAFATWTVTVAVAPGRFYTVTACRAVDTRNAAGPSGAPVLGANTSRNFPIAGLCGIPASAKAISANITVTQPTLEGNLRLYPEGAPLPSASAINYGAGQTRANNALLAIGPSGGLGVRCDQSAGSVHVLIDINGYFE